MGINFNSDATTKFIVQLATKTNKQSQDPTEIRWTAQELESATTGFVFGIAASTTEAERNLMDQYASATEGLNNKTMMGLDGDDKTLSLADIISAMARDGNQETLSSDDLKVK
jgi:hypothetical protein